MRDRAITGFEARFGHPPELVVRAPGRVNLLGGHTDYNEGYVLPIAIDRAAWVAAAPATGSSVHVAALDLGEEVTFPLPIIPSRQGDWADYVRGVAWALVERGFQILPLKGVLTSDVPMGAGLSSSAAVEVAFAWAWRQLSGLSLGRTEIALICRQAESEYVGVHCGVMDQMASVWGRAGHALLLDCRSLEVDPVRIPEGGAVLVADTGVRRELAASEYNRRRQECEDAVRLLSPYLPGIRSLRDLSPEMFDRLQQYLPRLLRKRVRHVVTENERVLRGVEALRRGDLEGVGEEMRRCHESLRDDYEVSSPELDLLAETAWEVPGCYGARLTGAGFGGCIVTLVTEDAVEELGQRLVRAYRDRFDRSPSITVCHAGDGVSEVGEAAQGG